MQVVCQECGTISDDLDQCQKEGCKDKRYLCEKCLSDHMIDHDKEVLKCQQKRS